MKNAKHLAEILGLGYYRVNNDGYYLECNQSFRDYLNFPPDCDISEYTIKSLYIDANERNRRLDAVRNTKGKASWGILSLRVNGRDVLFFDICWIDNFPNNPGGNAGMLAEITDQTLFPSMLYAFPMGMYEVNSHNTIIRANDRLSQLLGYDNASEIVGENLESYYGRKDDLKKFSDEVEAEGIAHNIISLRSSSNEIIQAEVFSQKTSGLGPARWGMLSDVTRRERYYRALDNMPTGYYYVRSDDDGSEPIIQCNKAFAKLFGFKDLDHAHNVSIRSLYAEPEDEAEFIKALFEADKENKPLLNYELDVKRRDNNEQFVIAIDAHLVRDFSNRIIGREGTVRDITDLVTLKRQLNKTRAELEATTADIHKLIHAFLHPVIKSYANAEMFLTISFELARDEGQSIPTIHEANALAERIQALLTSEIEKIEKKVDLREEKKSLTKIQNVLDFRLKKNQSPILRYKSIRDAALEAFQLVLKSNGLQKQFDKETRTFLRTILLGYLVKASEILIGETKVMKTEVEALRGFLSCKRKKRFIFKRTDIGSLLEQSIEIFEPVLAQKGIRIVYNQKGDLTAQISERDVDRMIHNILHNAYKYSHGGVKRYVLIEAQELHGTKRVQFSVTSYGIPITDEELESGVVFKFGGRSEYALLCDRAGTGVGLADTKETVDAHKGDIKIESNPVSDERSNKVPTHLTKITIELPKLQDGGKNQ